jgi:hypothetical protein
MWSMDKSNAHPEPANIFLQRLLPGMQQRYDVDPHRVDDPRGGDAMKQAPLFKRSRRARTIASWQKEFDQHNLQSAHLILDNPDQHCTGLIDWARAVLKRLEGDQQPLPNYRGIPEPGEITQLSLEERK